MNELFREAREHGAVPLNEATRASGDDKSKVSETEYTVSIFYLLFHFYIICKHCFSNCIFVLNICFVFIKFY